MLLVGRTGGTSSTAADSHRRIMPSISVEKTWNYNGIALLNEGLCNVNIIRESNQGMRSL